LTNYADRESDYAELQTQVLGIVQENPFVAKAFAEKVGTTLPVLSDDRHQAARAYGVFDEEKHQAIRTTFTVDATGVIRAIHQSREAIEVDEALDACRVLQRVDSTAGQ
jgi:peroxiredoxin